MVEKNSPERDTESDSLMGGFKVSFWGDENMERSSDDCITLLNILMPLNCTLYKG